MRQHLAVAARRLRPALRVNRGAAVRQDQIVDNPARSLLIVTHVFPPDSASVGQHMADVAATMRRRGWSVTVITGGRDFDNATQRFASGTLGDGTRVIRLPLSSFGKATLAHRVLGASLFTAQAAARILVGPQPDLLLVSDAPPFAPFLGPVARLLRRIPYVYWVMDINPDQILALGAISERSVITRAWRWMNRQVYRRAQKVVVLDRFMHERAVRQGALPETTRVLPPWPHDDHLDAAPEDVARFRREHGLDGRFVVMYSGNHAASHPLTTLLDAAERLQDDERFVFLFIGGGAGKRSVEERRLRNVRSLQYQPLDRLGATLKAADLHVVTMRDQMVGIVHTCKVYGIMSVGRPFLFFGPPESHVADLIRESASGWAVRHDDVDGAVALLEQAAAAPRELMDKGRAGRELIERTLSQARLRAALCDLLEKSAAPRE